MIKNKVLFVGIAGTVLGSAAVINFNKQYGDNEFDIVYLDKDETKVVRNLSTLKSKTLVFDDTKDAYVFNYDSFKDLDKDSVQNYLDEGGIIVVNDNEVTSEELKKKIDTNVVDFDYSKEENQYGFYVYNDGEMNVTINVSLGFLGASSKNSVDSLKSGIKSVTDVVEETSIVESIVSNAVSKVSLNQNFQLQDGSTGGGVSSSGSGKTMATAYLENILYLESVRLRLAHTLFIQMLLM